MNIPFLRNFWKRSKSKPFQTNERPIRQASDLRLFHQTAEIYSSFSSSRGFHFDSGDGLEKLLDKGLQRVLKEMVFKAIISGESSLFLLTGDASNALDEFDASFPFQTFEFGEIFQSKEDFRQISPSRLICMKSAFFNFDALLQSSCLHSAVVNEAANFLKVNNFTFLRLAGVPSIQHATGLDFTNAKKNLEGSFQDNQGVIFLGEKDDLQNVTRNASPIKDTMEVIFADAALFSGIPKEILFPSSAQGAEPASGNFDLFFLNIENICALMIKPFLNELLRRLGLQSNWDFKPIKPKTEKEAAEIEERQLKSSLAALELLEKLKTAKLDKEMKEDLENQIRNYLKNN